MRRKKGEVHKREQAVGRTKLLVMAMEQVNVDKERGHHVVTWGDTRRSKDGGRLLLLLLQMTTLSKLTKLAF